MQVVGFQARVRAEKLALFATEQGTIADVSFYRVHRPAIPQESAENLVIGGEVKLPEPASEFAPENLARAMKERYGETERRALALTEARDQGKSVTLEANQALHLVSAPFVEEKGLAQVSFDAMISGSQAPFNLLVAIQDPLNPGLDLTWMEFAVNKPGRVRLALDIPDQVLLPGARLWLTLRSDRAIRLSGPDGVSPRVGLHFVLRAEALPEALAYRKFLLKSLFFLLSEPRPWGAYAQQPRESFFGSSKYAAQCPELFMTIDQCHALAPNDSSVRQYREWVYLRHLDKLSPLAPLPSPPEGVPSWAWYPRLAWLEVRRIAAWWIENRAVPTGEFGGRVGDDSDMYQQYLDLPFFENDGVSAQLKENAAFMAELAEKENLLGGLNRHATDALHAYEEGINHLALMARWFYGDPIYLDFTGTTWPAARLRR